MQARPSCHENHAGGSSWHRFLQDQNKDCGLHRVNDRHDRGSAPGCSACLCMIHTSFVTASCSCESLSTPQLGSSRFSRQIRQRPSTNPIKMSCRFARVDAPPPQTRPSDPMNPVEPASMHAAPSRRRCFLGRRTPGQPYGRCTCSPYGEARPGHQAGQPEAASPASDPHNWHCLFNLVPYLQTEKQIIPHKYGLLCFCLLIWKRLQMKSDSLSF
jgi:hypothetical protein